MGLLARIFGREFEGKVVEVRELTGESSVDEFLKRWFPKGIRHSVYCLELTQNSRLKGYKEGNFAFNYQTCPPVYLIRLIELTEMMSH